MAATILCIETGTDVCSVALARKGEAVSLLETGEGMQHARYAALYVDEILRANGMDAGELSAVAVSKGPGSYTGLRIGVSLAKGICYAASIPLIAIGSLESLAYTALEDEAAGVINIPDHEKAILCPMIDARRMEVYCQTFDHEANPLSEVEAKIITPDSFAKERSKGELIVFGNGAAKCKETLTGKNINYIDIGPSARGLIKPAFAKLKSSDFEDIAYFEPFYLKDFVATVSTKKIF